MKEVFFFLNIFKFFNPVLLRLLSSVRTSNNALYIVRTFKHGSRKFVTDLWRVLRRVRALYSAAKCSTAHLISGR